MQIKVYGFGCEKHHQMYENILTALSQMNVQAEVVKITDTEQIAEAGFSYTPGMAIDDEPMASGRVLTVDELKILFNRYLQVMV